jgi:uncharacterized Zn finger protein
MFTAEDIQELSRIFGITPVQTKPKYRVRDGYVEEGDLVWWHSADGPEQYKVEHNGRGTIENMKSFPLIYSIEKPDYRVIYEYEEGF